MGLLGKILANKIPFSQHNNNKTISCNKIIFKTKTRTMAIVIYSKLTYKQDQICLLNKLIILDRINSLTYLQRIVHKIIRRA